MRIGSKVVVAFLAVSLVPTALLIWQGNSGVRDLGEELGGRARSFLEGRVSAEIRSATVNAAAVIEQQKRLIEVALAYQTAETVDALSGPLPTVTPYPYVLVGDGNDGGSTSSSDEPALSILLAPGVGTDAASEDIQRMSLLTPVYKSLIARHPDLLRRMFVTLESGVHAAFPALDAAPEVADPRERPHYWTTIEAGGRVWHPMRLDPAAGQRMVTVTRPVELENGRYAGVAGIEVRIADLLAQVQEEERLPPGARGLLLRQAAEGEAPEVVARLAPGEQVWRTGEAAAEAADAVVPGDEWQRLLDDLRAGRSGAVRMAFHGTDSLIAYAPVGVVGDGRTYLLTGVPYRQVAEEADAADAVVRSAIDAQLRWSGIIAVAVLVGVVVLAVLAARRLTRPVEELAHAAGRLARGDFNVRVEPRGSDELGDLGRGFNELAPRLGEMFEVEKSLELARDVQQHLLPARPPRIDGYDIAGASIYCDQTGGDYLDYVELGRNGGDLGIAVGDVAGHGVPAALLMTTARALLRGYAGEAKHPCDLVDEVNIHLSRDIQGGKFMTLFLMVLSQQSRTLEYVCAGHEPAFYYCPESDDFHDLKEGGIPLGIDAKWRYEAHSVEGCLMPGRVLVVATDGLWEARNPDGEMFGKERIRALVREYHHETAERIRIAVTDAVEAFRAGEPAADDVTVAVVKVLNGNGA